MLIRLEKKGYWVYVYFIYVRVFFFYIVFVMLLDRIIQKNLVSIYCVSYGD